MQAYIIAIGVSVGVVVMAIIIYMAVRLYKKSSNYTKISTKKSSLTPPCIILTSSSPKRGVKRLFSPRQERERAARIEREEKLNKQRKRERRKDIRSMWLPKRKDTLPITKTTIVQPMPMEMGQPHSAPRGRLTFSMHYQYKYESNTSSFIVQLLNASDLPPNDTEPLDVFVKTQMIPSRKQLFISKVLRQTLHPYFNETYEFDISYHELQTQKLLFHVMEYDCLSRHELIGEVLVNLADLGTHGFNILREVTLCINIAKPNSSERKDTLSGGLGD